MFHSANHKKDEAAPQSEIPKAESRDAEFQMQQHKEVLDMLRLIENDAKRKPWAAVLRLAAGDTEEVSFEKAAKEYEENSVLAAAAVWRILSKERNDCTSPIAYVNMALFAPMLIMCIAALEEDDDAPAEKHPTKELGKLGDALCDAELVPIMNQLYLVYVALKQDPISRDSKDFGILYDTMMSSVDSTCKLIDILRSVWLSAGKAFLTDGMLREKDESQRRLMQKVKEVMYQCSREAQQVYEGSGLEGLLSSVTGMLDIAAGELGEMIKSQDTGALLYEGSDLFARQKRQLNDEVAALKVILAENDPYAREARIASRAASLTWRSEFPNEAKVRSDKSLAAIVKEVEDVMMNPENTERLSAAEDNLPKFMRKDKSVTR